MLSGTRVIVAGAGLAGLTAARELTRLRASVRVVEARTRVGGRVWTRTTHEGAYVEAGAELIDHEHVELRRLVAGSGLRLVRVLHQGFGLAVRVNGRVEVSRSQTGAWRALARTLAPVARAYAAAGRTWDSAVGATIAAHSVRSALAARGASAQTQALAEAMRGYYLAEPDTLSALVVVDQIAQGSGNPGRGRMYRIVGGASRLTEWLATQISGEIHFRHVLKTVSRQGPVVRCGLETPSGRIATLDADFVVIAVPVPLVRAIEFDPPLPPAQADAYQRLSMGAATKLALRFDEPWWRRRLRPRAFGTNLAIGAVWDGAEEQSGVAMLTLLAGASASAQLRARLASGGPAGLTRQLQFMGTPGAARLAAPPVTWEDEPWSRGGYAVFGPGFDPRLRMLPGAAHGHVLFAGEHTSQQWQGFMNGAVESGQRVVQDLARLVQLHRTGLDGI